MLKTKLLIVHAVELVLYTWLFHDNGEDTLFDWAIEVVGFALLVRLIIIALTFVIARTPKAPVTLALSALAAEYAAAVYVFSYASLRAMPDLILPPRQVREHLPVLFVHGYTCNAGFWRRFIALFSPRWGAHLATISLEPVHGSIDDYAPAIEQRMEELLQASKSEQCLIVAHSMGGLASLNTLRHSAVREKVAGVITLGTPHQGTRLADFSFSPNAKQMRVQSAWISEMQQADGDHMPPIEALIGTHDNIVAPQENAALESATNTYMTGISHLAMAMSESLVNWTLERCERMSRKALRETELAAASNQVDAPESAPSLTEANDGAE